MQTYLGRDLENPLLTERMCDSKLGPLEMMAQIIKRIVRSFIHPSQIHSVNPHDLIVQSISNYKILENIRRMGIVYKDRGPKLIGLSNKYRILRITINLII